MRNLRLCLAYDGTDYVGWQVQPNGVSVQATVVEAIRKLTGEEVNLLVAGRTDSGVHALGQVANFQSTTNIPCDRIRRGLQNFLPADIVVVHVDDVSPVFHATYSAIRKRYRYVIDNRPVRDPFLGRYTWSLYGDLDADAMQDAAQVLLGRHDFRCFESHFPNKATSVRTIEEITIQRFPGWSVWNNPQTPGSTLPDEDEQQQSGEFLCMDIVADGFLYNMVRAIMGTLEKVGRGKWTADDLRTIVSNQNRSHAGQTAPPQGLYLVQVDYDE